MNIQLRGFDILHHPRLNKSTAFGEAEREAFGLVGLLPEGIESEETQIRRVMMQLGHKTTDLDKYIYLSALQDNDETLYYKTLMSDPAHFIPLVYTPTVGEACQKFGHILRRPRGLYLSIARKGQLKKILQNWPEQDVRFIVVTDGERILGLGDLGVNGMGIPIGKLALYTACAGVPPQFTLPITLDVGTNNEALLNDPLYLGLRQPRIQGEAYDAFIEEFVMAVQEVLPNCCIQFEDFANYHAVPLLERYRDRVCCFNDDIQGTAAIAVAGILAGLRLTGGKITEQTFLFLGAGSAGTGIADLLVKVMVQAGLSQEQARNRCWLFDINGLLESSRTDLADFQKPFAHPHEPTKDFVAAIASIKPTAIIGVSTVAKAFNQDVIETMAKLNERPIIFPYSNPTSHSECTAEEAYTWSQGRAVFASGSPFSPVKYGNRVFVPGQGNNVYIFPAMGMAIFATQAKRVTDELFIVAAKAVAEQVTQADLEVGLIYPPQSDILKASLHVAYRVAEAIFDRNLAGVPKPDDLHAFIEAQVYQPEYVSLI
ncbi:NAD-dependent malic enzyme [Kovacikia minuta CCNUW1]|uniref:NAD-dependent malic enzyme n=1 Tax=Kovacikia minuta TaxID=2931930 RepID=UPI001CCD570A|nr:NAD-dependent malic enzyme [Kovacikia minuta]UBF28083.1 NAD-dependent malic enzyme [Kovacikia minuta CCNUW1]